MSQTRIQARIDEGWEEWTIECDARNEGETAEIVKAIQGEARVGLRAKVREMWATEPIKAIFAVLAGIIVAFAAWYFGFR